MAKKPANYPTSALPLVISKTDGYYRLFTSNGSVAGPRLLRANPPDIPEWRWKDYAGAEKTLNAIHKHLHFTLPGSNV